MNPIPPVASGAAELLNRATHVLFDFDGPLVRLFEERAAPRIAADLLDELSGALRMEADDLRREFSRPTDPHGMVAELRTVLGGLSPLSPLSPPEKARLIGRAERFLVDRECVAARTARPTERASELVRHLVDHGVRVAVTSNNAPEAIHCYLAGDEARVLRGAFGPHVYGRSPDPDRMKPDPDCLLRAIAGLRCDPAGCLMIGDSASDFKAALGARVDFLGFGQDEGKIAGLKEAGVSEMIRGLGELL